MSLFCADTSTMEKKKIIPPPKRRKIESEGGNNGLLANNEQNKIPLPNNLIPMMSVGIKDMQIQQAKNYAITEAKQEGWLGIFRSFNSPFGNFLVPVIPTQADLFRTCDTRNKSSNRSIAQKKRREREKTSIVPSSSTVPNISVRGDIINPPSNRSIAQSLRRERERLLKNKEHSNTTIQRYGVDNTLLNHKTSLHNASTGSTSFTNNSSHHFSQANQTRVDHIEEESDITDSVDPCRNNMTGPTKNS